MVAVTRVTEAMTVDMDRLIAVYQLLPSTKMVVMRKTTDGPRWAIFARVALPRPNDARTVTDDRWVMVAAIRATATNLHQALEACHLVANKWC